MCLQVAFPSAHGLKTFLEAKEQMEVDLSSLFSQHLSQSASEPRPLSCEIETELFLIAPNAKQKNASIYNVTERNYSECLSMLKESDVFQFGPLFQVHQSNNPNGANGELYVSKCFIYRFTKKIRKAEF